MGIYTEGFGISGYRSFGKDIQRVGPLSKINIFAGQNNSGKSNIINYLMWLFPLILKSLQGGGNIPGLGELDKPMKDWDGRTRVEIGIILNGEHHDKLRELPNLNSNYVQWVDNILASDILSKGTNIAWIPFQTSANQRFSIDNQIIEELATKALTLQQWQHLWAKITNQSQGDLRAH